MKRAVILSITAVMVALYLGSGVMAFNSPISPPAGPTPYIPPPSNHVTHTPTPATLDEYIEQAPTATPIPVIPISPIFHSPIATPVPQWICVAPGRFGQVLCYEVQ